LVKEEDSMAKKEVLKMDNKEVLKMAKKEVVLKMEHLGKSQTAKIL
jgi:hypothetical protein